MSKSLSLEPLDCAISYHEYTGGGSNSSERERMKRIIKTALKQELTKRERELLCAYYFLELTMPQIAARYDLNKSTVSRTISRAKRKLQHIASYYDDTRL